MLVDQSFVLYAVSPPMLFIVQKRGARAETFHVLFNAFRDFAELVNTLKAERCIVLDLGLAI